MGDSPRRRSSGRPSMGAPWLRHDPGRDSAGGGTARPLARPRRRRGDRVGVVQRSMVGRGIRVVAGAAALPLPLGELCPSILPPRTAVDPSCTKDAERCLRSKSYERQRVFRFAMIACRIKRVRNTITHHAITHCFRKTFRKIFFDDLAKFRHNFFSFGW